jgi:hypothetical protein
MTVIVSVLSEVPDGTFIDNDVVPIPDDGTVI